MAWSPEFRAWLDAYMAGAPAELTDELDRLAQEAAARYRLDVIATETSRSARHLQSDLRDLNVLLLADRLLG